MGPSTGRIDTCVGLCPAEVVVRGVPDIGILAEWQVCAHGGGPRSKLSKFFDGQIKTLK